MVHGVGRNAALLKRVLPEDVETSRQGRQAAKVPEVHEVQDLCRAERGIVICLRFDICHFLKTFHILENGNFRHTFMHSKMTKIYKIYISII